MRWKLIAGVVLFFSLVEVVLGAVLFGPTLLSSMNSTSAAKGGTPQATPTTGNVILRENAWTGSNGWVIPAGRQATTQIQAYADATSVLPGKVLTFYVSTQQNGTQYWLDIYRLGWYGGAGGRLRLSVGMQVGHAQGVPVRRPPDRLHHVAEVEAPGCERAVPQHGERRETDSVRCHGRAERQCDCRHAAPHDSPSISERQRVPRTASLAERS